MVFYKIGELSKKVLFNNNENLAFLTGDLTSESILLWSMFPQKVVLCIQAEMIKLKIVILRKRLKRKTF